MLLNQCTIHTSLKDVYRMSCLSVCNRQILSSGVLVDARPHFDWSFKIFPHMSIHLHNKCSHLKYDIYTLMVNISLCLTHTRIIKD